jgi:hypothetical protein
MGASVREYWSKGLRGNICIWRVVCRIITVYDAEKERIFVSICSAVYLTHFFAFFESRDVVWRQNYVVYFTLKQTILNFSSNLSVACSLRLSSDSHPNPPKSHVTLLFRS